MSQNLFETAARLKLRFPSTKGELTSEQLWDVALRGKDGLEAVAQKCAAQIGGTPSFVPGARQTAEQRRNELILECVKHVIATKVAEEAAANDRQSRQVQRAQLQELLEQKQTEGLKTLTEAEIRAKLAELEA